MRLLSNRSANMRSFRASRCEFRSDSLRRRLIWSLLASVAVFAAVAYKILEYPQLSKPLWFGLAAATVVLWSAYHYLFLVHAGKTLGMMAVRLRLRGLKGEAPQRKQRRLRVLSMYFSTLSLGMGLMWVFADVDGFCWHDRLSRTFLTRQE